MLWQLAEYEKRHLHCDDISIRPQAADHGLRRSRNLGMAVKLIPRVNVRDMNFDDRSFECLQRVDKGDRGERIGCRIDDDRVDRLARGLDYIDQVALVVRLMERERRAEVRCKLLAARLDGRERNRTIDV